MGMNDFTPGYSDEYLAHSKGPWKKHKYISKVGNKYVYANKTGSPTFKGASPTGAHSPASLNRRSAAATVRKRSSYPIVKTPAPDVRKEADPNIVAANRRQNYYRKIDSQGTDPTLKVRSDKKLSRRARRAGYKTRVANAKYTATKTAKRVGADLKNKAYGAKYLAKAYRTKAKLAVSDAKRTAKNYAGKARLTAKNVTKRGKNAIRLLNVKYKGYVGKRRMQKIKKKVNKMRNKRG